MTSARDLLSLTGRGLSGGNPTARPPMDVRSIRVSDISPDPEQPRRTFDEAKIDELASSLTRDGLLQPIRVRPDPNAYGRFVIIAGERRWRAAQRAGLAELAAVVVEQRHASDKTRAEAAVENLQREQLNAVEEGLCYRSLLDAWQVSQAELARRLSKSPAHVSKMLAVAELDEETRAKIVRGELAYHDALAAREEAAAAAAEKSAAGKPASPRRRQRTVPRGTIPTPFGTVKLKRGAKLADLVGYLVSVVDQDKRDAA